SCATLPAWGGSASPAVGGRARTTWRGLCGRWASPEPELRRDRAHRIDHEGDVLVELDAQRLGALVDVVPVHAGRERRLLELLLDGLRLERLDPVRAYEPAGVDEPTELVAGEERPLERRVARQAEVRRVREDALDHRLGVALLAQDRRPVLRVLLERGVDLVVEVVQERGRAPELLILP